MQNECFVCGSNEYSVIDGAFVCNECGIQSQTIREEHVGEYSGHSMIRGRNTLVDHDHELTTGSQEKKVTKLLSWECFNLILIGLTDELIELGAKPKLKVTVLQLWVKYLQSIEVAFISKKSKKLPIFNSVINNVDGEILYGVKNIKHKIIHSKTGMRCRTGKRKVYVRKTKSIMSSDSGSVTSSKRNLKITNRLRNLDKSKKNSNKDSVDLSSDVSSLKRDKTSNKIKVKMTKTVKNTLLSMPSKVNRTVDESSRQNSSSRKCWASLKHKERSKILSLKKLIAIIRLALMINDDDIFLSDILRWIHEGHFHVNRVNLFLPENVEHDIYLSHMKFLTSRIKLNEELFYILKHLKADSLPTVNINNLITRFCDELQLPSDFRNFVSKLVLIFPPKSRIVYPLPDVEVKVMSYILFAAKFVFCLDGNAENLSSNFAEKINKSNKVDETLFNWNDYVQFIECRNSVISEYNYSLHSNIYGSKFCNTKLFLNYWNMKKSTFSLNTLINKDLRYNTDILLRSLPNVGPKGNYREIPASVKPLSTTLKWLFEYHSGQLNDDVKKILGNDFTQRDILYLTDEQRVHDLSKKCDVPVVIKHNKPSHYVKRKGKTTKDTKLEKNIKRNVKVYLRKGIPKNKQENNSEDPIEENPNTIVLGTGTNYWCIHYSEQCLTVLHKEKVNAFFQKQLPDSFLWFLNQCCRIIDCSPYDLYRELCHLEKKLSKLLASFETDDHKTERDVDIPSSVINDPMEITTIIN